MAVRGSHHVETPSNRRPCTGRSSRAASYLGLRGSTFPDQRPISAWNRPFPLSLRVPQQREEMRRRAPQERDRQGLTTADLRPEEPQVVR
jgi:hypothetical protein